MERWNIPHYWRPNIMPRHCNEIHHLMPRWSRYVIKAQNMRGFHGLMCSGSLHSQSYLLLDAKGKKNTANRVSNVVHRVHYWGKKRNYAKLPTGCKKKTIQLWYAEELQAPPEFSSLYTVVAIFRSKRVLNQVQKTSDTQSLAIDQTEHQMENCSLTSLRKFLQGWAVIES